MAVVLVYIQWPLGATAVVCRMHCHLCSTPFMSKSTELENVATNLNSDQAAQPTTVDDIFDELGSGISSNPQETNNIQEQEQPREIEHLALSEQQTLRKMLLVFPHDPERWDRLVELAESSGNIDDIQETYEALLKIYPSMPSAVISYLNHFWASDHLERIFRKFLISSPSVDVWKLYLLHISDRFNAGTDTRETLSQAYEFSLAHVGQDKDSGDIWMDYIRFLESDEIAAAGELEERQRMNAIREVYIRAVQIPIINIDQLWSGLEAFDINFHGITVQKSMADIFPSYLQAKTVLCQLRSHVSSLSPPSHLSRPRVYLPSLPIFNAENKALLAAWKVYLAWEESDPLELKQKDRATFIRRIQGAYRKAVITMQFFEEIWFMSYMWNNNVGKTEEALAILREGIKANPASFLLNLAYIEIQEIKKNESEAIIAFDEFLAALRANLEVAESQANTNNLPSNNATPTTGPTHITIESTRSMIKLNDKSANVQGGNKTSSKSKSLAERKKEYGLVWIMYMRAARRARSIQKARDVFRKARGDRWVPWEVWEAAALMEFHRGGTAIAVRIFDKALKIFGEDIEFVLAYLNFLISVNNDARAREVFERAIVIFPPDRARPLWEKWTRYEYQYGNFERVRKLEKRIIDVYPNDPPIKHFAQRCGYLESYDIATRDLASLWSNKQAVARLQRAILQFQSWE